MRERSAGLMLMALSGMEISWIYAWANFLMVSVSDCPFPLPETVGIYGLAAVLTGWSLGRGWRVYVIIGLHLLGVFLPLLRMVYVLDYWTYPFFSTTWLADFFQRPRRLEEWLLVGMVLSATLFLWIRGAVMTRRRLGYLSVCTRFDLGLSALFALMVVLLLLRVRGGMEVPNAMSGQLLIPFFLFGLPAVGLARHQSSASRTYLTGYRGIGILLSFALGALVFGSGIVSLFLPYLTSAAETANEVLKRAGVPLLHIFARVVAFIWMSRRSVPPKAQSLGQADPQQVPVAGDKGAGWDSLERILTWGFMGLLLLAVLVLLFLGLTLVARWLWSETGTGEKGPERQWRLRALLRGLWRKLLESFSRIRLLWKRSGSAAGLFAFLLAWGRNSGLRRLPFETPGEYGMRLAQCFPHLSREIGMIVEVFNRKVYGTRTPEIEDIRMASAARRRLMDPRLWFHRIRSRMRPAGEPKKR